MEKVWIIKDLFGRLGTLQFESRSQAQKWINDHITINTREQDEVRPAVIYLDTPTKLDR